MGCRRVTQVIGWGCPPGPRRTPPSASYGLAPSSSIPVSARNLLSAANACSLLTSIPYLLLCACLSVFASLRGNSSFESQRTPQRRPIVVGAPLSYRSEEHTSELQSLRH